MNMQEFANQKTFWIEEVPAGVGLLNRIRKEGAEQTEESEQKHLLT